MIYLTHMSKKRILTGLKPTGSLHLGNYLGSIRQMVEAQEEGEQFLFLADLHALTDLGEDGKEHDKEMYKKTGDDMLKAYIALGIDPEKTTIYRQSEFPQILEATWLLACPLKFQFLTTGHAYKDALQNNRNPGLGTFLYPALMAADILLPNADVVPVGKDQVQHIEMTREIARRFNAIVKEAYFTEPNERTTEEVATIPGIDGRKMSKSKGNTLPIFESEEVTRKKIMNITTDSTPAGQPISTKNCTVCTYLKLLLTEKEYGKIANKCTNGNITYKELKERLVEEYKAYFKEPREAYKKMQKDKQYTEKILKKDRKKINKLFTQRLNEMKELLGLTKPQKTGFWRV